jgi:lysyl endopeptidase
MLKLLARCILFALTAAAIPTSAQLSVPPATYQPAAADKAHIEPALLLPAGAAARKVELPLPSQAERAALANKRAAAASSDGVKPKHRKLTIGFARQVLAADGSFRLSDLAWTQMNGGAQVAHIDLTSPGAAAIRIGIRLTDMPGSLEMRFKGSGTAQVFGPFAASDASGSIYWSPVLEGETGTIELSLPSGASPDEGVVSLPMISHLVVAGNALRQADPLDQIGLADSCEVDVACMPATLKVQAASAVGAVARMVFTDYQGQTGLCSGTLINDSVASSTPYFFTASHCLDDDDDDVGSSRDHAATATATINNYWFFQTAVCGQDTAANVNFVLVAGGAKLLGRSSDYDWTLLRLNSPPPAGATFSAWNASPLSAVGAAADGIHHPEGDLKKYSQGMTQGFRSFNDGSSFVSMQWSQGVTEPGSSGSGLFTFNAAQNYYELRGALYGGDSACNAQTKPDIYSRMDVALPLLRQYLTPTAPNPSKETLVVEFYNATLDDYFITPLAPEIQLLDNGTFPGWHRTGLTFLAYSDPSVAPAGVNPVCRFYVTPQAGDSHSYSADPKECAAILTNPTFIGTWILESAALFYIQLPNVATGACPANTRAVYRFLNDFNGLHHRFTAEATVRDAIIDDDEWTQEGYGNPPAQSVMCTPLS